MEEKEVLFKLSIILLLAAFIFVLRWYRKSQKNDPVYNCDLYKEKGCAHVDGMLCDFPNCEMNNKYRNESK